MKKRKKMGVVLINEKLKFKGFVVVVVYKVDDFLIVYLFDKCVVDFMF